MTHSHTTPSRKLFSTSLGWLKFIFHLTGNTGLNELRFAGAPFFARRIDWGGVEEIFQNNEYWQCFKDLESCHKPKVLDLGANVGCFARAVIAQVPQASVLSVEAGKETFSVLHKNCQALGSAQWQVRHAAIWSTDSAIEFSVCPTSTASSVSSYKRHNQTLQATEVVQGRTINTLMNELAWHRVDLAKIDVEGAEAALFSSSADWLHKVDRLMIELHNDRIDIAPIMQQIQDVYPFVYQLVGRTSRKPLIYALSVDCLDQRVRSESIPLHGPDRVSSATQQSNCG